MTCIHCGRHIRIFETDFLDDNDSAFCFPPSPGASAIMHDRVQEK